MPIDPRIPLSVEPPAPIDPMRMMAQAAQVREAQDLSKMRGLQMDEYQRQVDTRRQIQDAVRQAGDLRKALPKIKEIDPLLGNDLEAKFQEYDQTQAKLLGEMTDSQRKRAEYAYTHTADMLDEVLKQQDPESKKAAYALMAKQARDLNIPLPAFDPDDPTTPGLPPVDQYDPDRYDGVLAAIRDMSRDHATKAKLLEDSTKQQTAEADVANKTAETQTKWIESVGKMAANVRDQAGLDTLRQQLVVAKAPALVVAQLPTQYSEAAMQRFRAGAMTEYQQQEIALERQKAAAAEEHDIQQEQAANPFGALMPGAAPRRRFFSGAPRPAAPGGPAPGAQAPGSQTPGAPRPPGTGPTASGTDATGPHGDAFLQQLPPQLAQQVKAMAEGRQPFPTGMSLARLQPLIQAVSQYDPSFDASNYAQRAKTRQMFTTGNQGQQINALNTVIGHMKELSDAAEALHNSGFRPYNTMTNNLGSVFGTQTGENLRRYELLQKGVADEATRVWRGTGGTEADIQSKLASLGANDSRNIQHEAISTLSDMLESKLDALQAQFDQAMGSASDIKMLTPQSQQNLRTMRQRAGKVDMRTQAPPAIRFPHDAQPGQTYQPPEYPGTSFTYLGAAQGWRRDK
jgi:uncharacterized protein YnzC (UPF0291/DUF896 family)